MKMQETRFADLLPRTLGSLVLLGLVTSTVSAQLMVDFSRAPDEFPLQEGWEPFVGDGTDTFTETYEFEGASVDITIEGNTHWRDYRAATNDFEELSDLLSDGPLCNSTCLMQLTFENLKDGQYELETVLHTTQFGPQDGRRFTPFEIRLTDGKVADEIVAEDKLMSDDSSDELSTETIAFEVVGGSPVEIVFDKPRGNDHLAIAGFQLLSASGEPRLMPGDADQDFDFDQLDLVKVQIAAKYLTGQAATWGEGDWDGAPGGTAGNPPQGDGQFNQLDIIGALSVGVYLTGPYHAVQPGGVAGDGQTSIIYNAETGEVAVDAPAGVELTSIKIDSASGIFTGEAAQSLGGSFDNDSDSNIFKATFGSSFGSLSFGNVAQTGLSEAAVLSDLTVVGSLAGGGDLGAVDLVYVPEPTSMLLLGSAVVCVVGTLQRRRHRIT